MESKSLPMERINTKTKCDQIVEEILSKIIKGEYKENELLPPERYFVDYFGVSRVTIRESFKKLNTLGVVTIQQGKGTVVNRVSVGSLMQPLYSAIVFDSYNAEQIYDVRIILESGISRLAALHCSEEDARKLRELSEAMDNACRRRDSETFTKLDIHFHETIVEIAQNEVLKTMYNTISDVIGGYIEKINVFSQDILERSAKSHHEICEAIIAHNGTEASMFMEKHIDLIKKDTLQKIREGLFPEYVN